MTFPIAQATGSLGYLEPTNDIVGAITSDVISLLLTSWGERVMHYDFGCNLRSFLFEPQTKNLQGAVAQQVKGQFARWMPFLQITGLYILLPADDPGNIPDPGFKVLLQLAYGNVPITISQLYPPA